MGIFYKCMSHLELNKRDTEIIVLGSIKNLRCFVLEFPIIFLVLFG
jgi:hypothetical protein